MSLEPGGITQLRVDIGGIRVGAYPARFTPSPDVNAAWPAIPGTAQCRFAIHADLDGDLRERAARREVITITPWLGDRAGLPLERIWPLAATAATSTDSEQVGLGDFVETSFSFLTLCRQLAGLGRDESILDAGCGIGRMAFSLSHYLSESGRYEGFDISSRFVQMARERYRDFPRFHFHHADIYNKMYNPQGRLAASAFRFPFDDGTFSFTFLTSVFTHMLPGDIRNYLREIRRTLRRDGRCLATFFVLDLEAQRLMKAGRSTLDFSHEHPDGCLTQHVDVPENAVAYREANLEQMIGDAGLEIEQFHPGSWPGRARFLSYQDVCLLRPSR